MTFTATLRMTTWQGSRPEAQERSRVFKAAESMYLPLDVLMNRPAKWKSLHQGIVRTGRTR